MYRGFELRRVGAPWGRKAPRAGDEVALSFPPNFPAQGCRIYARLVRSKEASGHVYPGAQREASRGRPYQFACEIASPPKLHEGCEASILVRFTGGSSRPYSGAPVDLRCSWASGAPSSRERGAPVSPHLAICPRTRGSERRAAGS